MIDEIRDFLDTNKHETKLAKTKEEIIDGFATVINCNSLENDCNTPDFILAQYLYDCLMAFNLSVSRRSMWYNPEGKNK